MMLYTAGATPTLIGEGAADAGDMFSEAMSFRVDHAARQAARRARSSW